MRAQIPVVFGAGRGTAAEQKILIGAGRNNTAEGEGVARTGAIAHLIDENTIRAGQRALAEGVVDKQGRRAGLIAVDNHPVRWRAVTAQHGIQVHTPVNTGIVAGHDQLAAGIVIADHIDTAGIGQGDAVSGYRRRNAALAIVGQKRGATVDKQGAGTGITVAKYQVAVHGQLRTIEQANLFPPGQAVGSIASGGFPVEPVGAQAAIDRIATQVTAAQSDQAREVIALLHIHIANFPTTPGELVVACSGHEGWQFAGENYRAIVTGTLLYAIDETAFHQKGISARTLIKLGIDSATGAVDDGIRAGIQGKR